MKRYIMKLFLIFLSAFSLSMCKSSHSSHDVSQAEQEQHMQAVVQDTTLQEAVFAAGCFWCVEAVFESVEGVKEAVSGYAGGVGNTATYEMVGSGRTDHAESVKVYYDPKVVDYSTLLTVFFGSQDPTTLNRQGPDSGTQYRSAIFYKNEDEKNLAKAYIKKLEEDKVFSGKITTTLEPLNGFFEAEDYHQNYERNNPDNPYVQRVSIPRLKRFQSKYPELLKKGSNR